MLKVQRGERMDEEFIRNRITELRLKKGVSEYQMSMELGQNRSYIQAISSGRSILHNGQSVFDADGVT